MKTPTNSPQHTMLANSSRLASVCFLICASALSTVFGFGLSVHEPTVASVPVVTGKNNVQIIEIPGFDWSRQIVAMEEYRKHHFVHSDRVDNNIEIDSRWHVDAVSNARIPFGVSREHWSPEIDVRFRPLLEVEPDADIKIDQYKVLLAPYYLRDDLRYFSKSPRH